MKTLLVIVVLVTLLCGQGVKSLPNGAPVGACDTLTPNPIGHMGPPQNTIVPYTIDLSAFNDNETLVYTPGQTYSCKQIRAAAVYDRAWSHPPIILNFACISFQCVACICLSWE